ncbi:MAG: dethiobiotin synthase [Gammaproteobacteria bacterium]|nr:dethiobiotin synthase [Gammaproteobacteria bacterium]
MANGFFITGTDTGIGKSWCSAALIWKLQQQGFNVAGMKPIASGCVETAEGLKNEDALLLQQFSSQPIPYSEINPYAFKPAIAPHIAAEQADICINLESIKQNFDVISSRFDFTIVEGVGGWLVPLNDQQSVADLATTLGLPVIMVVGIRLGCINHALLTAQQIQQSGCQLVGWIANTTDVEMKEIQRNIETIDAMVDAPLLGTTPFLKQFDQQQLAAAIDINTLI